MNKKINNKAEYYLDFITNRKKIKQYISELQST